MYVKNALKPGQFLTIVPVGLPMTLQYDKNGTLYKVYKGYDNDREDLTDKLLTPIKSAKLAPVSINVKDGDTFVLGVMFINKLYSGDGRCVDIASEHIVTDMQISTDGFHFAAGSVTSFAARFKEPTNIRRWLKMNMFDLLPGFLVPAIINKQGIYSHVAAQVKLSSEEIKAYLTNRTPMVGSYMLFENCELAHIDTNIEQKSVTKVVTNSDIYGDLYTTIYAKGGWSTSIPYSSLVGYHIRQKTNVVIDNDKQVVFSFESDGKAPKLYDKTFQCEWCGKRNTVNTPGQESKCADEHCMSRAYTDIEHFCKAVGIPFPDFAEYKKLCLEKSITWLPDLLELPTYKDCHIKTTVQKLLQAIIPVFPVPNRAPIDTLARHCRNAVSTVQYYIINPNRIPVDTEDNSPAMGRLVKWLSDTQNARSIEAIMFSPHVEIEDVGIKFEGAPIFRGRTIMITGAFAHGTDDDVDNILSSYSATVVRRYSNGVNCVVVGATKEGIDGQAIRQARWDHVPVMDEMDFFKRYEIDEDLREHKLI